MSDGCTNFSKIRLKLQGHGFDDAECQKIAVSAPSVKAARAIYEAVRTGKLQPTLDFETDGRDDTRASVPTAGAEDAQPKS